MNEGYRSREQRTEWNVLEPSHARRERSGNLLRMSREQNATLAGSAARFDGRGEEFMCSYIRGSRRECDRRLPACQEGLRRRVIMAAIAHGRKAENP